MCIVCVWCVCVVCVWCVCVTLCVVLLVQVGEKCVECGILFGRYFCAVCRLYDDADKGQFHCDKCGLCRYMYMYTHKQIAGFLCKNNLYHCSTNVVVFCVIVDYTCVPS